MGTQRKDDVTGGGGGGEGGGQRGREGRSDSSTQSACLESLCDSPCTPTQPAVAEELLIIPGVRGLQMDYSYYMEVVGPIKCCLQIAVVGNVDWFEVGAIAL